MRNKLVIAAAGLVFAGLLIAYALRDNSRPVSEAGGESLMPEITAAHVANGIETMCSFDSGGDLNLYAKCSAKSYDGLKAFQDAAEILGADPRLIECYESAATPKGPDFIKMGQCAEAIEAKALPDI